MFEDSDSTIVASISFYLYLDPRLVKAYMTECQITLNEVERKSFESREKTEEIKTHDRMTEKNYIRVVQQGKEGILHIFHKLAVEKDHILTT